MMIKMRVQGEKLFIINVDGRKKGRSGRKRKDWREVLERLKQLPLKQRKTIQASACRCGIPKIIVLVIGSKTRNKTHIIISQTKIN